MVKTWNLLITKCNQSLIIVERTQQRPSLCPGGGKGPSYRVGTFFAAHPGPASFIATVFESSWSYARSFWHRCHTMCTAKKEHCYWVAVELKGLLFWMVEKGVFGEGGGYRGYVKLVPKCFISLCHSVKSRSISSKIWAIKQIRFYTVTIILKGTRMGCVCVCVLSGKLVVVVI